MDDRNREKKQQQNQSADPIEMQVYQMLDDLHIDYAKDSHEACFTVEQAKEHGLNRPGINVKNLVILDPKTGEHYMVILLDDSRLDFKHFAAVTGWSKKATFAPDEDIFRYFGVHIGSCSVFGIINDKKNHITVVLEKAIGHADPDAIINFHPNVNTATVSIKIRDMFRFLDWAGNRVILEP
jgi:Ala-tRNA(Pro) deacylase